MKSIYMRVTQARRHQAMALIERAVARGELDKNVDKSLALDFLPAPLYWRTLVTNAPTSSRQLVRQANAVAAALRTLGVGYSGGKIYA